MTKALVVVAHPDDETIWMGGFIQRYNDWDWTIVSLCREKDVDRMPKFKNVCKLLNADSHIFDLDDTEEGHFKKISHKDIENRLLKIGEKRFDYVFTHGENGEYGHIRHKQVSKAVSKMIKDGKLKCKQIYYFSYEKKGEDCVASRASDKYISLLDNEIEGKKDLIVNVYGFQRGSFEEKAASNAEAFMIRDAR